LDQLIHVQRLGRLTQDVQDERPERALPRTRTSRRTSRSSGRGRLAPPDVVRLGRSYSLPEKELPSPANRPRGGVFLERRILRSRCGLPEKQLPSLADRPRRGVFLERKIRRSTKWFRVRGVANEKISCLTKRLKVGFGVGQELLESRQFLLGPGDRRLASPWSAGFVLSFRPRPRGSLPGRRHTRSGVGLGHTGLYHLSGVLPRYASCDRRRPRHRRLDHREPRAHVSERHPDRE